MRQACSGCGRAAPRPTKGFAARCDRRYPRPAFREGAAAACSRPRPGIDPEKGYETGPQRIMIVYAPARE